MFGDFEGERRNDRKGRVDMYVIKFSSWNGLYSFYNGPNNTGVLAQKEAQKYISKSEAKRVAIQETERTGLRRWVVKLLPKEVAAKAGLV